MNASSSAASLLAFLLSSACVLSACGPATPAPSDPIVAAAPPPPPPPPPAAAADAQSSESPPKEAASSPIAEVVGAADRSEADRALDEGRKPQQLLEFFGIEPGMRVAELGAGGGYTMELLARVVGPRGKVFAQNNKFVLTRFAEAPLTERLKKPFLSNVVRVDREFDDPLPKEATDLDAVLMVLFYHDTVWQKTDRAKMNASVFEALEPGGVFGIVDHNARKGAGLEDVKTLHRIEESTLINEVTRAGFVLAESADFLRNPDDERDWNASPSQAAERRGTSDRFVLRFEKPEK